MLRRCTMASVTDFLNANSHPNSITNCRIWDGDVNRSGEPIFDIGGQKMSVRALVYASTNGPQPARTKYIMKCENNLCVNDEHIEAELPEKKETTFEPELVANVKQMFFGYGKRQDVIAAELNISPAQISRIVNYIRRQEKPE